MKPVDLLQLLGEFYREKADLLARHEAVARTVGQYDFNNTYQYVIAREEQQLGWLRDAFASMDSEVPAIPAAADLEPSKGEEAMRALFGQDADALDNLVRQWRPRFAPVGNARHKKMFEVILGETLEHSRFFRQAVEGELNLLGRRTGGARTAGAVMAARWVE